MTRCSKRRSRCVVILVVTRDATLKHCDDQDHISQLARAPSVKKVEQSKDTAPPVTKSIPLGMQQQPSDSSRRYTIVQDTTSPSESPKRYASAFSRHSRNTPYTSSRSQRIPSITKKGPSDYTVWDAVPIPEKEPELDSHMLEIQSMLNDYLKSTCFTHHWLRHT